MWDNGSHASPFFIVACYAFCHYCTAVTMFKVSLRVRLLVECQAVLVGSCQPRQGVTHVLPRADVFDTQELDMREAGDTYFSDVLTFFQRVLDVLCYDVQMVASVVHSNRMLEGMTQVCA
jgi:hypothetical protein